MMMTALAGEWRRRSIIPEAIIKLSMQPPSFAYGKCIINYPAAKRVHPNEYAYKTVMERRIKHPNCRPFSMRVASFPSDHEKADREERVM